MSAVCHYMIWPPHHGSSTRHQQRLVAAVLVPVDCAVHAALIIALVLLVVVDGLAVGVLVIAVLWCDAFWTSKKAPT